MNNYDFINELEENIRKYYRLKYKSNIKFSLILIFINIFLVAYSIKALLTCKTKILTFIYILIPVTCTVLISTCIRIIRKNKESISKVDSEININTILNR